MDKAPYGIHWFRRDLRVAGNPALQENFKRHNGRVVGIFTFDKKFLSRSDFSVNRFQFFMETLSELKEELRSVGSDLLFMDVGPEEAFKTLFETLRTKGVSLPQTISWNEDYEPFAVARDAKMKQLFEASGVTSVVESDHVLIRPTEIVKDSDPHSPFQVFTPFQRKWLETFSSKSVQARVERQKKGLKYLSAVSKGQVGKLFCLTWKDILGAAHLGDEVFEKYRRENSSKVSVPIPKAGSRAAIEKLNDFCIKVKNYANERDFPALPATSQLSIYFKNGSLTIAQVIAELELTRFDKTTKSGEAKFFSELIWREFYYYILNHFPYVETSSFQKRFSAIPWQNNVGWFESWKSGATGYPIVDAGMRELNQTGWMHNRVRMIVASFLTKDLLISWQWGERYFMEKLLDGDLAPNNGGWQWAASTGCDAQPYFRIFNPELQSRKFDPDGVYIKKYVPELSKVDDLHNPAPLERTACGYPQKLVEHSEQRGLALEMYGEKAKQ